MRRTKPGMLRPPWDGRSDIRLIPDVTSLLVTTLLLTRLLLLSVFLSPGALDALQEKPDILVPEVRDFLMHLDT